MGMRLSILRVLRHLARVMITGYLLTTAAGMVSAEEPLTVTVDQALIKEVPAGTRTLIIGNPMIADVTLLKSGATMVVTGKGFGETNFIALDANGTPVKKWEIRVISGSDALVVQRGMERQSYTCTPRCQPTARLGDDPKYFNEVAAQIAAHNAQATK